MTISRNSRPVSRNARLDVVTADEVDAARFTPVRLSVGYAMKEVDDFLERVAVALRGGPETLTASETEEVRFPTTRWVEGYDMGEVDLLLDRVTATMDSSSVTPSEDATTKCLICYVTILVVDEDPHRRWHITAVG